MKSTMRKIFALLLALTLVMGVSVTALAADSSVTFKSLEEGFEFQSGSQYTDTDLFDGLKDVMPGDRLAETIQLKNEAEDCDYINLYMRAAVSTRTPTSLTA